MGNNLGCSKTSTPRDGKHILDLSHSRTRRPSVEGAPSKDEEIADEITFLSLIRNLDVTSRHSSVHFDNAAFKREDYQNAKLSHLPETSSKSNTLPDEVSRASWTRHRYLELPRRTSSTSFNVGGPIRVGCQHKPLYPTPEAPSKAFGIADDGPKTSKASHQYLDIPRHPRHVHFNKATQTIGDFEHKTSQLASGSPWASPTPIIHASSSRPGQNSIPCIYEEESTDSMDTNYEDSVCKSQKCTIETVHSGGTSYTLNEETIGSKFEAVHLGKSVLKINTFKRDQQMEDPVMRVSSPEVTHF